MASAACTCQLFITGTSTSFTNEATTLSGGDTVAQIDATAKRIWDPDTAISVTDNGGAVADADFTVNYLFGKITKVSGAFTGPVVITAGNYLPRVAVLEARSFEISLARELLDVTVMGSGVASKLRIGALKDASGSVSGLASVNGVFTTGSAVLPFADLGAGTKRVIEVTFPSAVIFRSFCKFSNAKEAAEISNLLDVTLEWQAHAVTGTDQTEGSSFALSTE